MMTDQWFIRKEGNQTGPFSFAQLQEKVKAGRLNESDLIRVEGFSDWQEASTVENLFNFQQVSPPLPGQTPKKGGMKRINLIAGGVLFGFILLLVVAFFLNDDSDSAEAPVVPATEVEVAAPPDINISDGNDLIPAPEEDGLEGVIRLELNAGGSLAKNELAERFLIYVLKDGYHASVYSHDLQTGTDKLLFGYDEYSDEGYYFPYKSSFALSPDGDRAAFTDREGLKVRFLSNNQQAKYIYKVQPGTGSWENQNGTPPVWSEDALNTGSDSYFNSFTDLSSPGWSYDGNYISFIHSTPGGESSFGLYDIKGGRYLPSARGCDLRWSPVENSYLLSRCDYGGGLFKSQKNDLASLVRLLEGEFSDSEINYSAPAYAADGSRVAFLYSREFEDQIYLGLAKADGSAFTEVAANLLYDYQHRSGPFFSADGNRIYYMKEIAGMQVLLTRELPDGEESNFLIMPGGYVNWFFMRWTAEGYLAIVGTYYHDFETSGARLIIIDPSAGNLVYAGAPINGFVYFAGFSKVPY